jgi:hypothetical protein
MLRFGLRPPLSHALRKLREADKMADGKLQIVQSYSKGNPKGLSD